MGSACATTPFRKARFSASSVSPEKGSDFREQSIPSGIYTLRFGLHPENGDHMGVAPSRDFAVLSPVDKDLEVEKNYDFDALVELTAEVGNPHPTVARLELPEGDDAPHLWENDYEHWVLDLEGRRRGGRRRGVRPRGRVGSWGRTGPRRVWEKTENGRISTGFFARRSAEF